MPSSVCASPSLRLFMTIYTVLQKLEIRVNTLSNNTLVHAQTRVLFKHRQEVCFRTNKRIVYAETRGLFKREQGHCYCRNKKRDLLSRSCIRAG